MDPSVFLGCHNSTQDDLTATGLDWATPTGIADDHTAATLEQQTTARYITDRIELSRAVHSLKVRVKNPQHLIAKTIRKNLKTPDLVFDIGSHEAPINGFDRQRGATSFQGRLE